MKAAIVAVFVLVLGMLLILSPVAMAKPSPSPQVQLQQDLSSGFNSYLQALGLNPNALNQGQANALFRQFVKSEPAYASDLAAYDALQPQQKPSIPQESFQVASLGPVLATYNETLNGTVYTVTVQNGILVDGASFVKLSFYGPNGLVDPWVYVTRTYLTFPVLWWTVTYGEDDWLYEQFVNNANGINEAKLFQITIDNWQWGTDILSGAIAGLLSPLLVTIPATVLGFALTSYTSHWLAMTIDNADDATRGLEVAVHNHYLYSQIGSGIVLWAWWWIDLSWHMAMPAPPLYFEALNLLDSAFLANALDSFGSAHGFAKWVWVGVYHG